MTCPNCGGEYSEASPTCPHCGWDVEALPGGTVLGERYEIVDLLGAGGLGRVYRARDLTLDEPVALKVLHPEATRSPELTRRFFTEIKLARKVRHRNVCAIHEYGEQQGLRFLAMELVDGVDLSRMLREKGPLPPREAFEVAVQVSKGLEAIHEAGVIHRDLKTPNIMRDSHGNVRLLDFGIAKRTTPHGTLAVTADQKVVGTPEYMSPEQIRGEEVGPRSDVYALGIVIYELFTGVVPFRAPTPLATLLKQITDPPPLEGDEAARLPRALIPVLRKVLAKDPKDRYASATELLEALRMARAATYPETLITPGPRPPFEPQSAALESLRTSVLQKPALTPAPRPAMTPRPVRAPDTDPAEAAPSARDTAADSALDSGRTYVELRPVRATTPASPYDPAGPPFSTIEVQKSAPPPPSPGGRPGWMWIAAGAVLLAAVGALGWRWGRLGAGSVPVADSTPAPSPPPAIETSPAVAPTAAAPSVSPAPSDVSPYSGLPAGPATAEPVAPTPRAPEPSVAAPTPRPRRPRTTPTPAPTPEPTPEPTPTPMGALAVSARPWAQVEVDDQAFGNTPVDGLTLEPGFHNVRLIHPDYWPVARQVRIEPGQKDRLEIDLEWEAVKRGGGIPYRLPMDDAPSDPFFERGERLLGEGHYREAKVMLMPVVRRLLEQRGHRKELACAAFYLGMAYLELGDTARARESFTTAIESDASLQPPPAAFSAKVITFFNRVKQGVRKK